MKCIQYLLASISIMVLILASTSNTYAAKQLLPKGLITLDGQPALELKLNNMDGEPFDLSKSRGHWVFVHFWATWCGPCRREMPTIQNMSSIMDKTSLEIVLINTAETDDTVFSFLGIVAPDLIPLMDYDGLVTQKWQPRGLPSTFLVDPEGKLRFLALGGREWDSKAFLQFLNSLVKSK